MTKLNECMEVLKEIQSIRCSGPNDKEAHQAMGFAISILSKLNEETIFNIIRYKCAEPKCFDDCPAKEEGNFCGLREEAKLLYEELTNENTKSFLGEGE